MIGVLRNLASIGSFCKMARILIWPYRISFLAWWTPGTEGMITACRTTKTTKTKETK
jgi:hypothetical protein